MRPLVTNWYWVLVLLVLAFIPSCSDNASKPEGQDSPVDDEALVATALADMMEAVETEDLTAFMSFVWEGYLNDGNIRSDLREEMEEFFAAGDYEITLTDVEVTVTTAAEGKSAVAIGQLRVDDQDQNTLFDDDFGPDVNDWFWGVYWTKDGSDWLVCGDRERFGVEVCTQHHFPDLYCLGLSVSGHGIESVSAAGPNIGDIWQHSEDHWVADLAGRPSLGDHYDITISFDDGSHGEHAYEVNGVNDSFATMNTPADGSVIDTLTPVFAWDAVADIDQYGVYVQDAQNERIWYRSAYPGETSCTYNDDGNAVAPLVSGQGYTVALHTFDANGNQATTSSTFTVQN